MEPQWKLVTHLSITSALEAIFLTEALGSFRLTWALCAFASFLALGSFKKSIDHKVRSFRHDSFLFFFHILWLAQDALYLFVCPVLSNLFLWYIIGTFWLPLLDSYKITKNTHLGILVLGKVKVKSFALLQNHQIVVKRLLGYFDFLGGCFKRNFYKFALFIITSV